MQVIQNDARKICIFNGINAFKLSAFNAVFPFENDRFVSFKGYGLTVGIRDGKDSRTALIGSTVISENGTSDHKYVIASCCNPIPGDNVIGFKASDGTVTVHKRSCDVANNLASKFGDKLIVPKWEHAKSQNLSFLVRLSLRGFDRIGIINDITRYISFVMSVNIRKFCLSTEDGIFDGFIDLYVNDMSDLDKLMKKLQKIEGIQSVIRTDL